MGNGSIGIGLVGAGPHASTFHAPIWAAGPETRLTAIWARRPEASASLARKFYQTTSVDSFSDLLAACDVVAFAIAPEAQWRLAVQAASVGKPMILEKPIADTVEHARALVGAVEAAGVETMVTFTARYIPQVRAFLDRARSFDAARARALMLNGGHLPTSVVSPWRRRRGPLFDIGPHPFDLLTAALGPALRVAAVPTHNMRVNVHLDHVNGARSKILLGCHVSPLHAQWSVDLQGASATLSIDINRSFDMAAVGAHMRDDLVSLLHGGGLQACDAGRGLYVHEIVEAAERSLADQKPIGVGR